MDIHVHLPDKPMPMILKVPRLHPGKPGIEKKVAKAILKWNVFKNMWRPISTYLMFYRFLESEAHVQIVEIQLDISDATHVMILK